MNDLNGITERILSDARADADAILSRAQNEAQRILTQYREKASARKSELRDACERKIDGERKRLESEAAARSKSRVLQEKAALIAHCIDEMEQRLGDGYATTYAPFFLRLLEQGATDLDAVIVFSVSDKDAEKFYQLAKERYAQLYPKRTLGIKKEAGVPCGGFILRYPHLSSPCTAKSVIGFYRLTLETRANKLLFETETA